MLQLNNIIPLRGIMIVELLKPWQSVNCPQRMHAIGTLQVDSQSKAGGRFKHRKAPAKTRGQSYPDFGTERCRTASNRTIPVATDTLRLSISPGMGMRTR